MQWQWGTGLERRLDFYPNQVDGWQLVSISKLGSWFLLMIISVVLVTWVYPPRRPDAVASELPVGMAEAPPAEQERPRKE